MVDCVPRRLPELGPEPPNTITRALLVYTRCSLLSRTAALRVLPNPRSDVVPEMSEASAASWKMLTRRPDFVFDALFVHARAAAAPMSQQVFNWLTNMAQQFVASPENEGLPQHQFFLEVSPCHGCVGQWQCDAAPAGRLSVPTSGGSMRSLPCCLPIAVCSLTGSIDTFRLLVILVHAD